MITQTKEREISVHISLILFPLINNTNNNFNPITSNLQYYNHLKKIFTLFYLKMKIIQASLCLISLLLILPSIFAASSSSEDFDFFYFVQQWPGSYCDTQKKCCYPTTGKPAADFGIHGLWPNYKDGTYPSNCDQTKPFDQSSISDLINSMKKSWPTLACPSGSGEAFWEHEWEKHGTCSESVINQHEYFQTALNLKQKTNLLGALTKAGINPDGKSYSLESIRDSIKESTGFTPWIQCNRDGSGNSQLYQVYLCVDRSASGLIECPVFPHGKCGGEIEFPSF